jgi:N-acyl-D-aspartate/D-glutamate deacylase
MVDSPAKPKIVWLGTHSERAHATIQEGRPMMPGSVWGSLLLTATFLAATAPTPAEGRDRFDILIRGGRIVDGTGNPWFVADLAIKGDRIAAIGHLGPEVDSKREIDARGLVVAPGFVDIHSHSDMTLFEDGNAQSKIRDGVTTEVLGEDTSGGPCKGRRSPRSVASAGRTQTWTTLGGYFDALTSHGIAVNIASYVGLGTLLQCVLGESLKRPDAQELEEIKKLLDEAMRDGALGLSTMLASARELAVTTDDIVALCAVVKRHGGLYSSHIRNEGTDVFDAVKEAIEIGRRSGVPVDIIHVKIADQSLWGRMDDVIALIDQARRTGVNVQCNVYPYTRGNNDLVSIIPPWAHEGGKAELITRLKDRGLRDRLKREIKTGLPGWYNHFTAVGGDWSRMLISASLSAANRQFQGQTMDRILAARSSKTAQPADPLDLLFDLLIEEKGSIGTIYAHHTESDMNRALVQPWCSIGSDGSSLAIEGPLRRGHPHPRSFGTFTRVLGEYVRARGVLRLEDAVRKMTSLNAAKVQILDRGLLRAGQFADISIFDAEAVTDRATYLDPFQYSDGIVFVVVNGQLVLDQGRHTQLRPGRALRRGR